MRLGVAAPTTLVDAERDAAREAIRAALVATRGNVRAAAKALGVSPATLHRRVNALALRVWLTEEYERGARQPARRRGGARRRA